MRWLTILGIQLFLTSLESCKSLPDSSLSGDTRDANRCLIIEDKKVLMVRVSHAGCDYDLPGGFRKSGESNKRNAAREAWEEAGVCAEAKEQITGGIFRCEKTSDDKCQGYQRTLHENCGQPEWISLSKLNQIKLRGSAPFHVLKDALEKSGASKVTISNDIDELLKQIKSEYVVAFDVDNTLIDWPTKAARYTGGKETPTRYGQKALEKTKVQIGKLYICSAHNNQYIQVKALKATFPGTLNDFNFNAPNYFSSMSNKTYCLKEMAKSSGKKVVFFDDSIHHQGEAHAAGAEFVHVDHGPGLTESKFREGLQMIVRKMGGVTSPTQPNNGEKLPWDGQSCQKHKEWGNCGKDFMIREGACHITCGNSAKPNNGEKLPWDGQSCQKHKEWGNCGKDFMIREGACHITCGNSAKPNNGEKLPWDGQPCYKHKQWGNCGKDFMIREGACHITCGNSNGYRDACGCPPGQGYSSRERRCRVGSVTEYNDYAYCR